MDPTGTVNVHSSTVNHFVRSWKKYEIRGKKQTLCNRGNLYVSRATWHRSRVNAIRVVLWSTRADVQFAVTPNWIGCELDRPEKRSILDPPLLDHVRTARTDAVRGGLRYTNRKNKKRKNFFFPFQRKHPTRDRRVEKNSWRSTSICIFDRNLRDVTVKRIYEHPPKGLHSTNLPLLWTITSVIANV